MADQLSAGTTVGGGRYVVEELIGSGGLADVYRVRQTELGSVHALKVLTLRRKQITERFQREARFQAQFGHPNVVRVIDFVRFEDGQVAFVMDYVDGPTLEQLLAEQGALPPQDAFALFVPILAAVAAAHERGVWHRDLKPANVLLERTPVGYVPKVADFGIAKFVTEEMGVGTSTGLAMGSPGYMAPEQARDSSTVDARADIFALGAILFEMLTGLKAFADPDGTVSFVSTLEREPPPFAVPDVSAEVAAAVRRAISKDRNERYPDCRTFARALGIAGHPLLLELRSEGRPPSVAPPLNVTPPARSVAPSTLNPPSRAAKSSVPPTPAPIPATSPPTGASRGWLVVPFVAGSVAALGTAGLLVLAALVWFVGVQGRKADPTPVAVIAPLSAPAPAPVAPAAPDVQPTNVEPAAVEPAAVEPAAVEPAPTAAPAPGVVVAPPEPLAAEPVPEPASPVRAAPVVPAPTNDAVARVEAPAPPPKPVPFDPMTVLRGEWKGKAGGRPCSLRFTSASGNLISGDVTFPTATTSSTFGLSGTFDRATSGLDLKGDGGILFRGTVSGGRITGQYSMNGSAKMLDWSVDLVR